MYCNRPSNMAGVCDKDFLLDPKLAICVPLPGVIEASNPDRSSQDCSKIVLHVICCSLDAPELTAMYLAYADYEPLAALQLAGVSGEF